MEITHNSENVADSTITTTTTNSNNKLKIKESYINQLDLSFQFSQSEFYKNSNPQLNENEKLELDNYLQQLKDTMFEQFKESVEIIPNIGTLNIDNNDNDDNDKEKQQQIQLQKDKSAITKIKKIESQVADSSMLQQTSLLQKQLETLVLNVTQLRQDVPSIIQAEISQNIQKLSSLLTNNNNNINNNNINSIPSTPLNNNNNNKKGNNKNNTKKGNEDTTNVDDNSKEINNKELEMYHQSVINIVTNVSENIESISTDSLEIKKKISDVLEKSKQAIEVTRILLK